MPNARHALSVLARIARRLGQHASGGIRMSPPLGRLGQSISQTERAISFRNVNSCACHNYLVCDRLPKPKAEPRRRRKWYEGCKSWMWDGVPFEDIGRTVAAPPLYEYP